MNLNWYALFTKPRCERLVSQRLQARGFETYLPALTLVGARGRRYERPFFPRHLFVRLDPGTDGLSSVQWTPGLTHVVRFGERPAVVPDEVVALIQERLAEMDDGGQRFDRLTTKQPARDSRRGDRVRIRSGPFADLEAVFERSLKPADRALMLISFLGRLSMEDGRGTMESGKGTQGTRE